MQGVPGQATFGGFTELLTWEADTLWDVAFFGFFFKQRRVYREKISSHSVPSHPVPLSQTVNVDTALGVLPEMSCTRKST